MSAAQLQHLPASATRPQRRCLQVACRAEHTQASQPQPASRRSALLLGTAAAVAAAVGGAPRGAAAAELAAAEAEAAVLTTPAPAAVAAANIDLDVANWPRWVDRTFSFSYPPGLIEVLDLSYAAPPRRAGADSMTENPLKAEVRSKDGVQRINVAVSQAATLKRTFTSVTDISQLGDPKAVARLLLPPGAVVVSVSSEAVPQPPRNSGLGMIERDPVCYYRYEVVMPDRTHLQLAAAAQLGRVYVLGGQVPEERWAECGAALRETAKSFRLRYKF